MFLSLWNQLYWWLCPLLFSFLCVLIPLCLSSSPALPSSLFAVLHCCVHCIPWSLSGTELPRTSWGCWSGESSPYRELSNLARKPAPVFIYSHLHCTWQSLARSLSLQGSRADFMSFARLNLEGQNAKVIDSFFFHCSRPHTKYDL